ncbi:MAG: 1,4-alpha-glucan branching protein domain-containing protein [Gemmatimonadota bacterium]
MDFVLALHSHLPYVLNHGRWPHGSDWISEAAIDTYLPLLSALRRLEVEDVPTPITIGITPILANQLESPVFVTELEAYFAQRLKTCDESETSLKTTGDSHLLPLAHYWKSHLLGLRALFRSVGGNLATAFRQLESEGRVELISSGATHGFLPLLARDESIRLQLGLGRAEHRRIFGRDPDGLWLPECAYRPRGPWAPLPEAPRRPMRRGIEEHVADAGFKYFFVDSHLASAGHAFRLYGAEGGSVEDTEVRNSPYRAYRVASARGATPVSAFVRDPLASRQVWSRQEGYPGDEWYLEFHKIRWPGGLKYWRVSAPGSDLGAKQPYDPSRAVERAGGHARHFVSLLNRIAAERAAPAGSGRRPAEDVIAAPFDTELFGHWWHEGVDFLEQVYRSLKGDAAVHACTARDHLAHTPAGRGIHLTAGSWGANGDFSMWLNDETAWTWPRLWAIEASFWDQAGDALESPALQPVLAQAAREMLLAMGSDWQFIISTGAVTDYAVKRFTEHCTEAEFLLSALAPGAPNLAAAQTRAEELWLQDHVFPNVLDAVRAALSGSRSLAV